MKKTSDTGVIQGIVNIPAEDPKSHVFNQKPQSPVPTKEIDPFVKQVGGSKGGENMGGKFNGNPNKFSK